MPRASDYNLATGLPDKQHHFLTGKFGSLSMLLRFEQVLVSRGRTSRMGVIVCRELVSRRKNDRGDEAAAKSHPILIPPPASKPPFSIVAVPSRAYSNHPRLATLFLASPPLPASLAATHFKKKTRAPASIYGCRSGNGGC